MLNVRKRWALPALLLSSIVASSCKTGQPVEEAKPTTPMAAATAAAEDTPKALGDDTDCKVDPAWIETPSLPDGDKFSPTSNCTFHQWAYQTFLRLVSTDPDGRGGALVFEGFANPKDLFRPGGPSGEYPGRAAGQALDLLARMAKSQTTADIDSIFQAGPGNRALFDQAGNIVYYSNHLNKEFWDFVVEHKLYDVGELNKKEIATLDFPVDALELKAAWRVVQIGDGKPIIPDAEKRYYVVEAEVPTVTLNAKGILQEDQKKRFKAKLALVGLHVAGVVKGHHELIWATFEHVDNAPNCAEIPRQAPQGRAWNFYDGKATKATANQFFDGDPTAPVNVCLTHPFGGGEDDNKKAIETLNTNVNARIKELKGADSVLTNYFLGGAVWTDGTIPVNNGAFLKDDKGKDLGTQLGSLDLANTTMETFTQNDNCFACHNGGAHEIAVGNKSTQVNAKHINLSHFVVNYQAAQQVKGK